MTETNRSRMKEEIKSLIDRHLKEVAAIRKKFEGARRGLDGPAEREIKELERINFKEAAAI